MPNINTMRTVGDFTGTMSVPHNHSGMGMNGLDHDPKRSQKNPASSPVCVGTCTGGRLRFSFRATRNPIRLAGVCALFAVLGSGLAAYGQLPPTPERSADEPPRPRLFAADRVKNIGEVIEGEKVEVVWRIENHGNADLIISDTRASCGCTVAPLSKEDSIIPPGGHIDFKAHFDSRGRRGAQQQDVSIISNDPIEPQFGLQFVAQVSPLYEVRPPGLVNLRMVRRGDSAERYVELFPAPGRNQLEIIDIRDQRDGPIRFEHEPVQLGEDRVGQRISLMVADDVPLGRIQSNALVRFKVDGYQREHALAVRGEVVADLIFRPVVVDATRQPLLHGRRLAPVIVESTDRRPFKIVRANAGPLFDSSIESAGGGRAESTYNVYLTVREDAAPGPFGTSLAIQTDSLDQPVINIPVFGIVAPRVTTEPELILLRADGTRIGTHRRVKVQAASPATFIRPSNIECDIAGVDATIDERASLPYRHLFFLDVKLTGNPSSGRQEGTLVISTDEPEISEIRIPVVVEGPKG